MIFRASRVYVDRCIQVETCILRILKCKEHHPTHIGGLSDEPLLSVKDVSDASDQLQGTAVIRALKENEHMCSVKAC